MYLYRSSISARKERNENLGACWNSMKLSNPISAGSESGFESPRWPLILSIKIGSGKSYETSKICQLDISFVKNEFCRVYLGACKSSSGRISILYKGLEEIFYEVTEKTKLYFSLQFHPYSTGIIIIIKFRQGLFCVIAAASNSAYCHHACFLFIFSSFSLLFPIIIVSSPPRL